MVGTAALLAASGCTTGQFARTSGNLARGAVDSMLGFPAISVVVGANEVLDSGNENAHERRVEELNSAYAEFVGERHSTPPAAAEPAASIVTRTVGSGATRREPLHASSGALD